MPSRATKPQPPAQAEPPQCLARRGFLSKSLAASIAAPFVLSLEEKALLAQEKTPASAATPAGGPGKVPLGAIGKVKISRLICGGNLISGYAHSRDLIYLSSFLKTYFTEAKIMETWAICEQHGINTMIGYPADARAIAIYRRYTAQGGRIQYLAQIGPEKEDLKTPVKQSVDSGAVGAFLLGNLGDQWAREGAVGRIGQLVSLIKEQGLIAGVAGHEVRTPMAVEQAGVEPDFYLKTLHSTNYWSHRRPGQDKEVIDNYAIDNYWCMNPEETIAYMRSVKRAWIAYKVLAAGAIHPREGFRHAFENGADFAAVGMFDFQVAEDAAIASEILSGRLNRRRPWLG